MSEDRIDYGEIICEAVDNIVSKKLEGLEFDITKTCRIIDDTYKKQGRYTVTDNSIKFEAYSAITTLNIGDSVLVNIPYGDYNNQKTILNKIIYEDESTVLNYKSPLEAMLKFTKNILNELTAVTTDFSILANGEKKLVHLYSFKWSAYSGYDRMGVSAKFLTWLGRYDTIRGSYGLKFIFSSTEGNNDYELDFNIKDMTGNPYEFETYYKQEKLFDISQIANVELLDIYLYLLNDFYNEEDELVPSMSEGDAILGIKEEPLNNNIKVEKDTFEIYLGYDLTEFNGDSLKISTPGYLQYSRIEAMMGQGDKELTLRWVHEEEDGSYNVITADDIAIRNIEIYWFRYLVAGFENNTTMENIASGKNWTTTNLLVNASDPFKCTFTPDTSKEEEKIKVVCKMTINGVVTTYTSDIITFENELPILDTSSYNNAAGLWIKCVDNSEGNYFIYDQSSEIINEGQGQGFERRFEIRYSDKTITKQFESIDAIEWVLPYSVNTMLTYKDSYYPEIKESYTNTENQTDIRDDGYIVITRKSQDGIIDTYLSYNIKNVWHQANSNNNIKCMITADGNVYQASLDLNFGKSGTSGTNLTLVLDFENGKNAYRIGDGSCYIKANLYDMAGSKVNFSAEDTLAWSWYHEEKGNGKIKLNFNKDANDQSRGYLTITENNGIIIPESNYHILLLDYTPKGKTATSLTTLTAYLTIPVKNDDKFISLEGARKVIYNSQSVPSYYTDAYVLYTLENGEQKILTDITWELQSETENKDFDLKTLVKDGITYYALVASPIYIKNSDSRLCINAKLNGTIVWSLPILVMLSQYDYAIVNEWSGTATVSTDTTIMTTMLGAGKKNSNNEFSGILIGDVSLIDAEDGSENITTGLYALKDGITTFSLTDNGMMKLQGSVNLGCIIFGSDSSNIIQDSNGRFTMDIDSGKITITDGSKSALILNGDNSYLLLLDSSSKTILNFNNGTYLLQSGDGGLSLDLANKTLSLDSNSKITGSSSIACGTLSTTSITCSGTITASEIQYKNLTLSSYIQSLIDEAIAGLE